jgi:hypothetical protein
MNGETPNICWEGLDRSLHSPKKGARSHLPERPFGCFAQMTPDPFFLRLLHRCEGGRIV